jgi:hypothetical protein
MKANDRAGQGTEVRAGSELRGAVQRQAFEASPGESEPENVQSIQKGGNLIGIVRRDLDAD